MDKKKKIMFFFIFNKVTDYSKRVWGIYNASFKDILLTGKTSTSGCSRALFQNPVSCIVVYIGYYLLKHIWLIWHALHAQPLSARGIQHFSCKVHSSHNYSFQNSPNFHIQQSQILNKIVIFLGFDYFSDSFCVKIVLYFSHCHHTFFRWPCHNIFWDSILPEGFLLLGFMQNNASWKVA